MHRDYLKSWTYFRRQLSKRHVTPKINFCKIKKKLRKIHHKTALVWLFVISLTSSGHSNKACLHFSTQKRVASSIPVRSHTFVEIDHEIISTVILLPSADSFKKGCCQLQAKVCARITGYPLVQACPGKSVVRWTDRPAMTIAVDLERKATKQTNKQTTQKHIFIYLTSILHYQRFMGF